MRWMLLIPSTLILSGCATLTGIVGTENTNTKVCGVWRDVSWSKKDTDQTIGEIKINNAKREAWCHGAK